MEVIILKINEKIKYQIKLFKIKLEVLTTKEKV